jgi:EmrB/QacA subfamily drug resistance transporter
MTADPLAARTAGAVGTVAAVGTVGAAPTAPPPPAAPTLNTGALFVVLTGAFLSMVDFFIVNVALGDIAARLRASTAALELVVAGYGVTFAVLLVLGGRLGDMFGRRRLFLTGMAAFVVASATCGLAPSATWLIAARIVQGAAAALVVPQVLATIQATSTGERRARAIGLYGATAGLSAVVGQVVGGVLVSADVLGTGWRPVFLVNVPIGLVALALAWRLLPETRSERPAGVDLPGTVLLAGTTVSLLLPLSEGRAQGWPLWSWLLLAASPVLALALLRVELREEARGRTPLLPPSVLRTPTMLRGLTLAVPVFVSFGGFMFCYAVATQQLLRWSPVHSGLTLAPMAVAFLLASLLTPRLLPRLGRSVLTVGFTVQAVTYPVLAAVVAAGWDPSRAGSPVTTAQLAPLLAVAGFGQGMVVSPLFGLVLSRVPVALAGVGSGVLATTQQAALAIGSAGIGTAFVTLAAPEHVGARGALLLLLVGQGTVSAVGIGLSRLLPDHGRAPR